MISNRKVVSEIQDSLSDLWAPVRKESVCDWVEQNVEIPTGAITGKVQMKYTPYAREILERYGDKRTRHLVLVFPTQAGKTSILINGMLYKIARDAEDAMWVMGNADQARDFNKERFMPAVRLCKAAMDLVPRTAKGVPDKHMWGFQNQHYLSMVLNFVGAGSTTNLSSRPRGFMQLDECDKYYDQIRFDAGTIQLAEERQKTFHFPLSVKASSPTLVDRMIWVEYLKTDQRQYWLPCPRCEREILLKFKIEDTPFGDCGLRWWVENEEEAKTDGQWDMRKVKANAFYKCQECGGKIHDFERADMLPQGVWKEQNPRAEAGRHGYHLNSLYSILGQETSLGNIAVKFMIAKGLRSELQNFINGWLAEPWDEAQQYEERKVKLEVFSSQDIPQDSSTPIFGIDCQQDHFWALIRRFAKPTPEKPHGESWLLFADRVDTEQELIDKQKEYEVDGENVLLDMAHRPNQVAAMIIKNKWRGIWGSNTAKQFPHKMPNGVKIWRPYSQVETRDPLLGTKWEARTLERARYIYFGKSPTLDLVSSLRYADPPIWHVTVNASPRYGRQLNSRVKRQQKNKRTGRAEWEWIEKHQENHLSDCENFVAIRALQEGLIVPPPESSNQNVAN